MAATDLKGLLAALSGEEKKELILAYYDWANQEMLYGAQQGIYNIPAEGLKELAQIPPETIQMLDESIANGDKRKSLKMGITEIFRGLAIMQQESTGPQLNTYLKAHLPEHLFTQLYEAAGLNVNTLKYDPNFPTDPIEVGR